MFQQAILYIHLVHMYKYFYGKKIQEDGIAELRGIYI